MKSREKLDFTKVNSVSGHSHSGENTVQWLRVFLLSQEFCLFSLKGHSSSERKTFMTLRKAGFQVSIQALIRPSLSHSSTKFQVAIR